MPLSILGNILWFILALFIIAILLLVLLSKVLSEPSKYQKEKGSSCLYSEYELVPGLWAHNDGIAVIHIWEDSHEEEIHYQNPDDAWEIESVETEGIPDSLGTGTKMTLVTKNGRIWQFSMYFPERWKWLIRMPLIRFLNDSGYREKIERIVNSGECDSSIELLVACCLLHAPKYHTTLQEAGKTLEQLDTEQAERLLLSSAKKGNTNAMFELVCLYHEKREYEKAVEFNNAIKSKTEKGVWFVDRFEQSLYHIKKDS